MAERDRSQEASSDTEIRAMMSIKRTFEVLDRSARRRVLEWASHRYVDEPLPDFDPDFTKNLARFTEGLAEAARQIGNITPLDIIRAANEIARLRDEAQIPEVQEAEA